MGIGNQIQNWTGQSIALGVMASLCGLTMAASASAQDGAQILPTSIPDEFERAFFSNDRDFYANRRFDRQINYMFGVGAVIRNGFPENEITRDGRAVNILYREVLASQLASGPLVRTRDLPSPFNQSLLTLPIGENPSGILRPAPTLPIMPPIPSPTAPQRQPVPALW
jgi:hypothetical protein